MRYFAFVSLFFIATTLPLFSQLVVVKYAVQGTGKASLITYTNADGGMSQLRDVTLPWQEFFVAESNYFASISAQNGEANTIITVEIYSRKMKSAEMKERTRRMSRLKSSKISPSEKESESISLLTDLLVNLDLKKQSSSAGAYVIASVTATLK